MKKIVIMGATGSIGEQVFSVVQNYPEYFCILGVAIQSNIYKLISLFEQYEVTTLPRYVAISGWIPSFAEFNKPVKDKEPMPGASMQNFSKIKEQLEVLKTYYRQHNQKFELLWGADGLDSLASLNEADLVLAAIVGAAGLSSTIVALKSGKTVALANKEALIMAGSMVMDLAQQKNAALLPVDSEHGALFRLLINQKQSGHEIEKLWLPASGGALRDMPLVDLDTVTPEIALQHPTWSMGKKITIDSATLVNKGLEVIEAHYLFQVAYNQIDVVIHRESLVHAMVEYRDGFIYGEISPTSMTYPIGSALFWPDAIPYNHERLRLDQIGSLNFSSVDHKRYPALKLCYQAGKTGGNATIALNAANEIAVEAYLSNQITYPTIVDTIEYVLNHRPYKSTDNIEEIWHEDMAARKLSSEFIALKSR